MDGSQDFTASRLNFEIGGDGVAVDPATGCLSLPADRLAGITVTVTATDAAGRATSRYRLSVAAVAIEVAPTPSPPRRWRGRRRSACP